MHHAGVVAELHLLSRMIQERNRRRFRSPIVVEMLRAVERKDGDALNDALESAQRKQCARFVTLGNGLTTVQTLEFWRVIIAWGRAHQSLRRWQDAQAQPGILRFRERYWKASTRLFVSRAYRYLQLI